MYKVAETQTDLKLDFEYEFTLEGKDYLVSGETEGFITDYYNNRFSRNPANRWVRQDYDVKDFNINWIEFFMDGEEIERAEFWERLKESKQTECTSLDDFIESVIEERIEEYDNN